MPQPGDSNPLPHAEIPGGDHNLTHDLMPWHDRWPMHRQIAVHHVQIGPAHPTGKHPHQQLSRSG